MWIKHEFDFSLQPVSYGFLLMQVGFCAEPQACFFCLRAPNPSVIACSENTSSMLRPPHIAASLRAPLLFACAVPMVEARLFSRDMLFKGSTIILGHTWGPTIVHVLWERCKVRVEVAVLQLALE